jgi:Xaa-Pro aminopeptidase
MRITQLREVLAREGVHALLVPSADPHLSEYLPPRWQGREWLSGFTGSMATLVVAADRAVLFADSRYWMQAENELAGTGIELEKIPAGTSLAHIDWLAKHTPRGATVAVDGQVLGLAVAGALQSALTAAGVTLRTQGDLLDDIWPDRPGLPTQPVYEHSAPHATQSRAEKLAAVRKALVAQDATHHFVSTVDDIAWLTNLRGSDVSYNPVFLAHLLLDLTGGTLFIAAGKVSADLAARLAADGVRLAPYADAAAALTRLGAGDTLLIDPKRITFGLRAQVGDGCTVREAINPSTLLKSRKGSAEAAHVREAMAEDGAAMCEFYAWFEAALARGERLTELTVDERLSAARARRPGFVGLSFATIAGFNANGAMPHYRATEASHAEIQGDGLLLIDSGGQYLGGTTDITRVWPIGSVSAAMKRDYTLVLKGTMNLSRARFPRGTLSPMLDRGRGIRPRHRPRRGLFPGRARRAADHQQGDPRRPHGDGARHDHQHRARCVPRRPVGRAHREPGAECTGRDTRRRHLRRIPGIRDADAVPHRHPLHRAQSAARRRTRLAERLPRQRARHAGAAGQRCRTGLADRAYRADLNRVPRRTVRVVSRGFHEPQNGDISGELRALTPPVELLVRTDSMTHEIGTSVSRTQSCSGPPAFDRWVSPS